MIQSNQTVKILDSIPLPRKRVMVTGKLRQHFVLVLAILFFASLPLLNLALPDRHFSEHENRFLQKLPRLTWSTLMSGSFGKSFEAYIQDQFAARDWWISLKTISERTIGRQDNGRIYFGRHGYLINLEEDTDSIKLQKNSQALHDLIVWLDQIETCRASIFLVPSVADVLPQELPHWAPFPDARSILDPILRQLDGLIQPIDSLAVMQQAAQMFDDLSLNDSAQLYYRTDHHWTTAGAYVAYKTWALTAGFEPIKPEDFVREVVSTSFYGTTWSRAHVPQIAPDSIEVWRHAGQENLTIFRNGSKNADGALFYPSFLNKKDQYAYFLGGNDAVADIQTQAKTGRTLLVIKDSYANALVPFLVCHFDRILLIDPRYLNGPVPDFLQQFDFQPTDFLLLAQLNQFARDPAYARLFAADQ